MPSYDYQVNLHLSTIIDGSVPLIQHVMQFVLHRLNVVTILIMILKPILVPLKICTRIYKTQLFSYWSFRDENISVLACFLEQIFMLIQIYIAH